MEYRAVSMLALVALLAVWSGCGDDDSSSDAGTDGGGDSDTDGDGDSDTSPVSCGGLPDDCDDIGSSAEDKFYGCCWDNTVYWCGVLEQEWVMQSQDCDELDMTCAHFEAEGYVWCI